MSWRRISALFSPRNSSRSEHRLFAAYNRFRIGAATAEDAELIVADLANFTGFYRVHPPDDALAFQEGKRAATAIYRRQYWTPVRGDDLPAGVDYAVFDFAIHSGVRRASEYLQRAVGAEADGLIGVETLAAVRAAEPAAVVAALCAARLRFLKRIRNRQTGARLWTHFGKGWQRRVEAVEAESMRLAAAAGDTAVPDVSASGVLSAWAATLKAALVALLRGLFRAPA